MIETFSIGNQKILISDTGFTNTAADPFRKSKTGGSIGGSANLSDKFMSMVWDSPTTGKIIVKNENGKIIRELSININ